MHPVHLASLNQSLIVKLYLCNRQADDVSPGDEVLIAGKDQLIPAKVINVASSLMQGKLHLIFSFLGNFCIFWIILIKCIFTVSLDLAMDF